VIVANSWAAFARYQFDIADAGLSIEWTTIVLFISVGAVGTFVGKAVGGRIDQRALKRLFAVFLIVMGLVMIARESVRLLNNQDSDQESASNS
ncbi:MAG: TSUP family transporter, partial [Leptolyngbya sp. SIO3F4]|nr:TSUP family transporter [Leptolyngbya sp. SIO3F4]